MALSSPPGPGRRAVVRLSGPEAIRLIVSLLINAESITVMEPRTLSSARIYFDGLALPVLLACFVGPYSYTGQDMIELQTPSHPALLDRLLHALVERGARLAEPGEFTFRAYLAGKLNLVQAEGVAATIAAAGDAELTAAREMRQGRLGELANQLVETLAIPLALLEAGIDFIDQEDVVPIRPRELDQQMQSVESQLHDLLANSRSWSSLQAMPRIVLVGAASTGKSTLFNALLGRERAVVCAAPGTTRDLLTEPIRLTDPVGRETEAMLIDIAGLDTVSGALDHQMQAAARMAIEQADLILHIDDGHESADNPAPLPPHTALTLHVRTKIDLSGAQNDADGLGVCALTGAGVDQLRCAMTTKLSQLGVSSAGRFMALQPRHESAVRRAYEATVHARELLSSQQNAPTLQHAELLADHLRQALDELAGLGGAMTPDDVIGRIFANFCIGK